LRLEIVQNFQRSEGKVEKIPTQSGRAPWW